MRLTEALTSYIFYPSSFQEASLFALCPASIPQEHRPYVLLPNMSQEHRAYLLLPREPEPGSISGGIIPHICRYISNVRSCWTSWLLGFLTLCLCSLSSWYVHVVLISLNTPPHELSLTPGRTVLAVNVVAHVVAFMVWNQIATALETLRWALAARPGKDEKEGISLALFLALSRATTTLGVALLTLVPSPLKFWSHQVWCVKRYVIPYRHGLIVTL